MSAAPAVPRLELSLRRRLDRFELDVEVTSDARVTGVFGPSGAGKSSLLRAVAGLDPAARGTVRLDGETWLDSASGVRLPPERRGVGYVPQDGLLFPHRSVRGNLLAGARRARGRGADAERLLGEVCALLELTPLLERRPALLSGGERQRVAVGRALCSGPRLLLFDEPLASLDLPLRRRILPLLARVREEFAVPMVLVSHDPTEVQALCDSVVVLAAGRVVATGPPHRVLTDPAVYPLAGEGGYENVLPAVIERVGGEGDEETAAVRLRPEGGAGGAGPSAGPAGAPPLLVTPRPAGHPGDALFVGIPAREILVSTHRPRGLSARNVLPARVTAVRAGSPLQLLTATVHPDLPELAVEVSAETCTRLDLRPGRRVHLIVKAAGCVLYEGRGRDGGC